MKRYRGFTLVELVVTVAILCLLLGIVFINNGALMSFARRQSLKTQCREVHQVLLVNKNNAMMDGYTRVIFIDNDRLYIQTVKEQLVETEKIEFRDSIQISSNTYHQKRLEFKPIGTVNFGGHFTFESVDGDKMTIVVQVASGRIYLKEGGS